MGHDSKETLWKCLLGLSHERNSRRELSRKIYDIVTHYHKACSKLLPPPKPYTGEIGIARSRGEFFASTMGDDKANWRNYGGWSDW